MRKLEFLRLRVMSFFTHKLRFPVGRELTAESSPGRKKFFLIFLDCRLLFFKSGGLVSILERVEEDEATFNVC